MQDLVILLDWVARLTSLAVLAGGAIAWLSRERIKHYFASDLEERKAKLMRELEAYKVSLIADSERLRATQDVKKAMALRLLDRRLDALIEVVAARLGLDVEVAGFSALAYAKPDQFDQVLAPR